MGLHKLTEADVVAICEARERGLSYQQIARRYPVSAATVEYHCRKNGAVAPRGANRCLGRNPGVYQRGGRPVRGFSSVEDETLLSMRNAGKRVCDIARALGRRPGSVRNRLLTLAFREAVLSG